MKKFRTKMDRLARALMALVVAIALVAGGTGCFGTTGAPAGTIAQQRAVAPSYTPLSQQEVALLQGQNFLLVGSQGPMVALDPLTTPDYVSAMRDGVVHFRAMGALGQATTGVQNPYVVQMAQSLLDDHLMPTHQVLVAYVAALGVLSASRVAMGALEEQYAAQNEICNGRGDSSHQGNVNRLKALMERDKALFESLSGQPNVGAAALASAKSGYETHMGLYDKARASQASCQQDLANGVGVQARDQQQRLASALADAQSKLRAYRERRAAFNQALAAYKAAQQTVAAPAK